mmetsp:Transcript_3797/g.5017  ORF Transcript_3797/g.5017 Transcript_3797/m.5017 type:complete len:221 (-) Transcript_3797:20-682(-)
MHILDGHGFFSAASIHEANHFVLATGGVEATTVVPSHIVNQLIVSVETVDLLTLLDIEQLDGEVSTGGGQYIGSSRVKLTQSHFALVSIEVNKRLCDGFCESSLWNTPNFEGGIVTCSCDNVLVERIEVEIENSPFVSSDTWACRVNTTRLCVFEDSYWAASANQSNCEELGVCLNVRLFTGCGRKAKILEGIIDLWCFYEHMAVFGLTNEVRHIIILWI